MATFRLTCHSNFLYSLLYSFARLFMSTVEARQGASSSGSRRRSPQLLDFFNSEPVVQVPINDGSGASSTAGCRSFSEPKTENNGSSPDRLSPSVASTFAKSPWTNLPLLSDEADTMSTGLVGSLVREEGHVYSLATAGDLLFTGSESKDIRVWKGRRQFAGFKCSSGLVKAIVVAGDRIFTGHQDGKIRVWKTSSKNSSMYKQVATLPRLKDFLKSSMNPSSYVQARRRQKTVWLRHFDAISSLHLDEEAGILYSGSWDKTLKAWRISDLKCLESVSAHDDAVNAVAAGFGGFVFTGSADGTVKVWRREEAPGGATRHVKVQTLLRQESAVTAVALALGAGVVYCGSSDGTVNFWRWERGRQSSYNGALRGHKMAVLCLAVAGNIVVSGSADKTLCVWRRDEAVADLAGAHKKIATLMGHAGPIKCLAVEEDRTQEGPHNISGPPAGPRYVVYSGSLDRSVKIWRILESEIVAADVGRRKPKHKVAASAGDGLLLPLLHVPGGAVGRVPHNDTCSKLRELGAPVHAAA